MVLPEEKESYTIGELLSNEKKTLFVSGFLGGLGGGGGFGSGLVSGVAGLFGL